MPIAVQCPECSARLNAPDAAAGKRVKCPKCGAPVAVTAPAPAEVEVVDEPEEVEPPDEPEKKPKKKVARAEDDEDETPRRKKRPKEDDDSDEDEAPRKKRAKAEAGSNKGLLFALIGVGGLLLLGGIGAAVYFATRKAPDIAKGGDKGGDPQGKGGNAESADMKVISPRARFKADFKSKEKMALEVRALSVSANGKIVIAGNGSGDRLTQVWSVAGDPKQLSEYDDQYTSLSTDGTLMSATKKGGKPVYVEAETQKPTDRTWTAMNPVFLQTATDRYQWSDAYDARKASPFKIFHYELPSEKSLGILNGGDEDRVALAAPVKDGKELVFGVPPGNKVRVFDFAAKAVVREFPLSNPREFRGPAGQFAYWSAFNVSSDGKWISVKREQRAKDPDPIEIFDSTGALTATLGSMTVSDYHGRFLRGRDVYIAPGYVRKDSPFTTGDIAAYDINKKAFVAVFRWDLKVVTATALSADGKTLAAGATDGSVAVWDLTQLP